MGVHPGEVREIKSEWVKMAAPLPDDSSWYHPQYAKDELEAGEVNNLLWKGRHPNEHWQRHATGVSLPRLLDLFRKQYTHGAIAFAFVLCVLSHWSYLFRGGLFVDVLFLARMARSAFLACASESVLLWCHV